MRARLVSSNFYAVASIVGRGQKARAPEPDTPGGHFEHPPTVVVVLHPSGGTSRHRQSGNGTPPRVVFPKQGQLRRGRTRRPKRRPSFGV